MLASITKPVPVLKVSSINLDRLSDADLIANFKKSQDRKVIAVLFDRYKHLVMGVCLKYHKDIELCKDLMMNIFEELIEELPNQVIKNFKNWLYTVTRNKCIKYYKDQQETLSIDDEMNSNEQQAINSKSEEMPMFDEMPRNEIANLHRDMVHEALQQIPKGQRDCIFKFYFEKKTYKQIEEDSAYSIKQVKSNIQNGKRKLKLILIDLLSKEEIDDRDEF